MTYSYYVVYPNIVFDEQGLERFFDELDKNFEKAMDNINDYKQLKQFVGLYIGDHGKEWEDMKYVHFVEGHTQFGNVLEVHKMSKIVEYFCDYLIKAYKLTYNKPEPVFLEDSLETEV